MSDNLTSTTSAVWTHGTVTSTFKHIDLLDGDSQGAVDEWRVECGTEGDIDEEEPSADWALGLVLNAHGKPE